MSHWRYHLSSCFAVYAAVFAFALIELGTIPMVGLAARTHLKPNFYLAMPAFLDWAACVACVLLGTALAPGRKGAFAVGLSVLLAVLHFAEILAVLSFSPAVGEGVVPLSITYYGGLLTTGAVLCLIYEQVSQRSGQARSRALASISGPSIYSRALSLQAEAPGPVPLQSAPFDLDLVLLEDELLKIRPDRQAYISSMHLGMAIEKDCGFVNCRARSFTFSQLMLDVSMRLSVTAGAQAEKQGWLKLADTFRQYAAGDERQRRHYLNSAHGVLEDLRSLTDETPTSGEDEAQTAATAESKSENKELISV